MDENDSEPAMIDGRAADDAMRRLFLAGIAVALTVALIVWTLIA